jgi:hypothetical protein
MNATQSLPPLPSFGSFFPTSRPRVGKIARLPESVRLELNQRLFSGHPAHQILPWLNALPEVQQVLAEFFDGQSISAQNLSAWRNGGFSDWVREQQQVERIQKLAAFADEVVQAEKEGAAAARGDSADAPQRIPTESNPAKALPLHARIIQGALVLAAANMFQFLDENEGQLGLDQLGKAIKTLVRLRSVDLTEKRTEVSRRRVELGEKSLKLSQREEKHRRRVQSYRHSTEETIEPEGAPTEAVSEKKSSGGMTREEFEAMVLENLALLNQPLESPATKGQSSHIKPIQGHPA